MHFHYYGGKGGVGKTTCAAARAVAESAAGRRVLVVSTDPAHSLGDALARTLTSTPSRVGPRLSAVEIDAPRAFRRWLRQHRAALGDIVEHGTWLDREDVEALLDLSIPGVDELVALLEITRLARTGIVDCVVVDTAPTGHALRMLAAPETVAAVAGALDAMHETHRIVRDRLARVGGVEPADRLIALLADQAQDMATMLRDRRRTSVNWVTLPEDLSVAETADALATLDAAGISVEDVVVNRVLPRGAPCRVCDRRRALEADIVVRLRREQGRRRRHVRIVVDRLVEPRGLRALTPIGADVIRRLTPIARTAAAGRPRGGRRAQASPEFSLARGANPTPPETVATIAGADLLFFAGKGGVGKTTTAAATALRFAAAWPDRRVLLMSTDPAHSLSDVLNAPVGDEAASVRGAPVNLSVREVDSARAFAARRAAVESALDELADRAGAGATTGIASGVMDLAPPGIDELFGMLSILQAGGTYDLIVVDTAPTGHALRLLEIPAIVRDWVQALLRVLLKYRSVAKPGALASELVELSQSIRELSTRLQDAKRTRFVVVTRAAEIPLAETTRLLHRLRRLSLAVSAVVSNAMTLGPERCPRCRTVAAAEQRALAAVAGRVTRRSERCAIIRTPLSAPPPRGADRLMRWGAHWTMVDR